MMCFQWPLHPDLIATGGVTVEHKKQNRTIPRESYVSFHENFGNFEGSSQFFNNHFYVILIILIFSKDFQQIFNIL